MITRGVAACLCAFFAALSFSPVFAGTRFAFLAAGAVMLVGGACLALAFTTVSKTVRVAAASAVLILYTLLAIAPGLAIHHGLRRLLTAALPAEPHGPELATVVLLAGLATLSAVEPTLRSSLMTRRRPILLALLGPLALAALGCAIAAPAGPPPAWPAAAFTACAAALLWLHARPSRPTRRTRFLTAAPSPLWLRLCGAVVTLAVLGGAAIVAASASRLLAGADPAQARAQLPAPVEPRLDTSPLALFPALRTGRRPLSLAITAPAEPSRLRFATLDTFDGTYWTTAARYRWAGRHLPAAPGTIVEERVQVLRDDALGWLVSSGRPVYVSTAGLGVDEVTGDVVVPSGQAPPRSFTIRSALPPPVPADLAPERSTMDCAPDLAEWAALATGGSYDLAALHRLEAHLRDFRRDDRPEAPGGHGLFQIRELRASRSGTAEQFASAFAVLARCAGFDSRVVTGFRPRTVRTGEYTVTGEDVHAWAEVRFAGGLWASFDPTPSVADPSAGSGEPEPTPTPGPDTDPALPPFSAPDSSSPDQALPAPPPRAPVLTLTVLTGLAVLLAYAILVPLGKRWRRFRRRRTGSPRERTLAAWQDTLDRLAEAALRFTPADTAGQVVAAAGTRFGANVATPLHALALLHDEAAYAQSPARDLASPAWRLAADVRAALFTRLPRPRRALATLNPRPLFLRRR